MPKTAAERNRDKEARKREAGYHEYRVWAPKTPEAAEALRDLAKRLTDEFEAKKPRQ